MESKHIRAWKLDCVVGQHGDFILHELSLATAPQSLDSLSATLPQGGYTTFRTYQQVSMIGWKNHMLRLADTARIHETPVEIPEECIRRALRMILHSFEAGDYRVRITIDLSEQIGNIYIAAEALRPISEQAYRTGVKTVTCRHQRSLPDAKLTNFIRTATQIRQDLPADVNEAVMVNEQGELLEGLSSNVFFVIGSELYTAGKNVLAGITRSMAIRAAQSEKLPIHYESVALDKLSQCEEVFLTSASRGILPVVQVDQQVIGAGLPGPVTRRLMQRFQTVICQELVEL
jgi:branched-chain amino acid aminotransferase